MTTTDLRPVSAPVTTVTVDLPGDMARTFVRATSKLGRRGQPPVLDSVVIRPTGYGSITLSATDLGTFTECEGPGTGSADVILERSTFAAIVKAAGKADRVAFELVNDPERIGAVTARVGGVTMPAYVVPASEYPRVQLATIGCSLPPVTPDMVRVLAAHASRDDLRPILTAAWFADGAYVATDGYRLAAFEPTPRVTASGIWNMTRAALEIVAKLPAAGRKVSGGRLYPVKCDATRSTGLELETETRAGERVRWSILSRTIDGDYCNWVQLMPANRDGWNLSVHLEPIFAAIGKPGGKNAPTIKFEHSAPGIVAWSVRETSGRPGMTGTVPGTIPAGVVVAYNAAFLADHAGPGLVLNVGGADLEKAHLAPSVAEHPGHGIYRARTLLMPVRWK